METGLAEAGSQQHRHLKDHSVSFWTAAADQYVSLLRVLLRFTDAFA